MPELDYALLADFAAVQDGKLTVVGGSYTRVVALQMPTGHPLGVAGRIRAPETTASIALTVRITAPDDRFTLNLAAELVRDDAAVPYRGILGFLFALNVMVPLVSVGLYEVYVDIEGVEVRRLAFDVDVPDGSQGRHGPEE